MTDQDRSIRPVRVALFLFGVPFALSLVGLGLEPTLAQVVSIQPAVLQIIAAATAIGLLIAMLMGWAADRRALRTQERELISQANELTVKRQELEAQQAQHALQLSLKEQQLEKEIAVREERIKVRELEHALALREAGGEAEPEQGTRKLPPRSDREPPSGLTRERRVLVEPGSVDPTLEADTNQESVPVPDVLK